MRWSTPLPATNVHRRMRMDLTTVSDNKKFITSSKPCFTVVCNLLINQWRLADFITCFNVTASSAHFFFSYFYWFCLLWELLCISEGDTPVSTWPLRASPTAVYRRRSTLTSCSPDCPRRKDELPRGSFAAAMDEISTCFRAAMFFSQKMAVSVNVSSIRDTQIMVVRGNKYKSNLTCSLSESPSELACSAAVSSIFLSNGFSHVIMFRLRGATPVRSFCDSFIYPLEYLRLCSFCSSKHMNNESKRIFLK